MTALLTVDSDAALKSALHNALTARGKRVPFCLSRIGLPDLKRP